jgi:hypothetical protein
VYAACSHGCASAGGAPHAAGSFTLEQDDQLACCTSLQALRDGAVLVDTVVRIIRRDADEEEEAVASAQDAPDTATKGLPARGGGSAVAVAHLFTTAPHTVPYGLRVDLFRRLIQLDKVRPFQLLDLLGQLPDCPCAHPTAGGVRPQKLSIVGVCKHLVHT